MRFVSNGSPSEHDILVTFRSGVSILSITRIYITTTTWLSAYTNAHAYMHIRVALLAPQHWPGCQLLFARVHTHNPAPFSRLTKVAAGPITVPPYLTLYPNAWFAITTLKTSFVSAFLQPYDAGWRTLLRLLQLPTFRTCDGQANILSFS